MQRSPIIQIGLVFFGVVLIVQALGLAGEPGYENGGPGGLILGLIFIALGIDRYRRSRI